MIDSNDPLTAPGHTDLMVTPENIDAFLAANPLPEEKPADHKYEPGAYGVCRRCGQEEHPNP